LIAPFGWLSNWSCIRRAGLVPRFMPLNDDLQLDAALVADRITARTGAVIVTHLLGRGQQAVEEIATLCDDFRIPLLEDVAQSFGVAVSGRRVGTFGVAAWCSLNHHKILSTGDGGFVLVRDESLFTQVSALHDQGCIIREGNRRPAANVEPGLSLRTSELVGAILRAQLARFNLIRARVLTMYLALAESCESKLNLSLIPSHDGDLPFTVMFKRPPKMAYPSLVDSGWHIAGNVPWLSAVFAGAAKEDSEIATTVERLAATSAIGAGFVDPYYAVPLGLGITDSLERVPQIIGALEKTL
jgi:dTDP-4-amino-4,6-dideoxygalactose transaminase